MACIYVSTRNENVRAKDVDALLQGVASDGGLYVLDSMDNKRVDLSKICKQDYIENACDILSLFFDSFTKEQLFDCLHKAYDESFDSERITPIKMVDGIPVLELFHGPTCAFKDVALCLLPQLMSKVLEDKNQKVLILTATSGDTGKAALAGFKDVDHVKIIVFYPDQKVSKIQHAQMVTSPGKNVRVYGIKGNFDDAQSACKKLFVDTKLNEIVAENGYILSSANSMNIGRLLAQIVYYFESYKQLVNNGIIALNDPISFSVPTGNFGDVLAGYYAYVLGLPVKRFYVASNANHVLTDFFKTGIYDRNREFVSTISPSMDILVSSNLERLLYFVSGKDHGRIKTWMQDLNKTGRFDIGKDMLEKLQSLFVADYLDDDQTKKEIERIYSSCHEILDPHSAIGYALARQEKKTVCVSLATASPYKFAQDVLSALHKEQSDPFQALKDLEELSSTPCPESLAVLPSLEVLHPNVIDVNDMKRVVLDEVIS